MAPPSWATATQLTWLNTQYSRFLDHQKRQKLPRFWPTLEHEWFTEFPERAMLFGEVTGELTPDEEKALGEAVKARKNVSKS